MIQRIQTLFLLLGAGCFGALFGVPFAMSSQPDVTFFTDQLYTIQDNILLLVSASLGALILLIAIFTFRNRTLQRKLGYVGIVLAILVIVEGIILFYNESHLFNESLEVQEQAGIFLPILAIIFVALANRYIKRDQRIVSSMDRLR